MGQDGLSSALVPTGVGFGLLALAWDHERVLRRIGVFAGSIVAMAGVLYGVPRRESATVSPGMTPEQVEQARQAASAGFVDFLSSMIHFEYGYSLYYQVPVGTKLAERLPFTVVLRPAADLAPGSRPREPTGDHRRGAHRGFALPRRLRPVRGDADDAAAAGTTGPAGSSRRCPRAGRGRPVRAATGAG
ncbi:hypothetical protein BRC81_01800 [Halobacteriales archaeon QS_1_68_20]|nr:MAG: hypothetical protein BRC81_01800 [Halobacteriales archaeon QS_1_68_20]